MTPQQIEAMKQALEALENIDRWLLTIGQKGLRDYEADAITALEEALAQPEQIPPSVHSNTHQPEQEPVAHWSDCAVHSEPAYPKGECDCGGYTPPKPSPATDEDMKIYKAIADNYTAPPQRTWVGLTDEKRSQLVTLHHGWNEYGQAIEASLKQQNGYTEENT